MSADATWIIKGIPTVLSAYAKLLRQIATAERKAVEAQERLDDLEDQTSDSAAGSASIARAKAKWEAERAAHEDAVLRLEAEKPQVFTENILELNRRDSAHGNLRSPDKLQRLEASRKKAERLRARADAAEQSWIKEKARSLRAVAVAASIQDIADDVRSSGTVPEPGTSVGEPVPPDEDFEEEAQTLREAP